MNRGLFDQYFDDSLVPDVFERCYARPMGIVGKKDGHSSGSQAEQALRGIAEKGNVFVGIIGVQWLGESGCRRPSDGFDAGERQLYVDVTAVRFHGYIGFDPALEFVDIDVKPIAIDVCTPDGQGMQVGVQQEMKCLCKTRMQGMITRVTRKGINDHSMNFGTKVRSFLDFVKKYRTNLLVQI